MEASFAAILTAVLAANLLTAMFLYGMVKAFRIGSGEPAPIHVALCIAVPALAVAGGALLFG